MSQPRAVLIARRRFGSMAFVVALRGDLATSRLTDECAALPAEPRNRSYAVTKRQIAGDASVGASLVLQGEYNARNRRSSAGRVRHRAGRYVADLGGPRQRRGHRTGSPPQSRGRAGVLAPVPLALVAPPLSSSLVVAIADDGPGGQRRPARWFHPAASDGLTSRWSAAMKFARASARLSPRGSST
jgi:hypothetical protein